MHTLRLINFPLNKELKEIYIFIALKSLAVSMFGIFIPLYLLIDLNFSLKLVLLFFIFSEVIWIAANFLAGKALTKIGAKHSILLAMFFTILYLMFLVILKHDIIDYFYLAAFFHGMSSAFYWIGFHSNFVKSSDKKHRGEETMWWKTIPQGMNLIGPFLGGIIITLLNFEFLFIIVSILLILSTIPLFTTGDVFKKHNFYYKKVLTRGTFKEALALMAVGIRGKAFAILWPIFIFFILGSFLYLGSLFSFVTLLGVIFFVIAGKWSDNVDKKTLMSAGTMMHSFTWFIRAPINTALQIFSIASLDIITYTLVTVPFDALSYDRASEGNPIEYMVFRESMINLGSILILSVMFFIPSFALAFIITGLTGFLLFLF